MSETNRIYQLIDPFLWQLQEDEYVLNDLRQRRTLSASVGTQLDGIGDILDVYRVGMIDSEYRTQLQFKIFINTSTGTPEQIISFIKVVTGAIEVKYQEFSPATIKITTDTFGSANMQDLYNAIIQVVGSGVKLIIVYVNPALDAFAFANEGAEVTDGLGFDKENGFGTDGGVMSEKI